MNKCIIVYMESFIAYDPSTKTGELHAILTIDISLRSFLFYAAWQNMTHDKSLNLCTWMTMPNHEMKPITMNHKPKTKTKTKTLTQPDYLTSSSLLRMPSIQEARSESRRDSRRESRRSRSRSSSPEPATKKSRKRSSTPEPAKKSRKRSRSRSPEKKERARKRSESPSTSPSPKREKRSEKKPEKSNSRQRSSSNSRHQGQHNQQGQQRPPYSTPTPWTTGTSILNPAQQNIGGFRGSIWYKGWLNKPPGKPPNYTITFAFGEEYEPEIGPIAENVVHYMTKVLNTDGTICRRPHIELPQLEEREARRRDETKVAKAMGEENMKFFSGSPVKKAPAPPLSLRPLPSPVSSKNLGKTMTDQNEDQARITAEQILTLTFGLDSFETDHSVFVALGEFMKVDVGQITSTLPTRTDAKDKLVTAMMILIKEKKARPNYPDIIDRAEAIKKDRSNTSAEKITTEVSTPVVKIEPNENVDTPSSDPFNEQNKKRQRKSK